MYLMFDETKILVPNYMTDPNNLVIYIDPEDKEMGDIYDLAASSDLTEIRIYNDDGSMLELCVGYVTIDGFAYIPSFNQLCLTLTKIRVEDVKESITKIADRMDTIQTSMNQIKNGELTSQSNYALQVFATSLTDEQALNCVLLFDEFDPNGKQYKKDDRFRYNDKFWKVLQDHTSQSNWLPGQAPSLYVEISDPAIEWPEWKQPTGAHDAYNTGDKVTHNDGKHYISQIDGNTTEPGTDERWWKEEQQTEEEQA